MNQDTYRKNRKVLFLYATTITCVVVGLMLHFGKLVCISEQISQLLTIIFILAGYYLILKIASRLKEKEIHGLTAIAWASLLLFGMGNANEFSVGPFFSVLRTVSMVVLVYFLVDGIIRFVISLVSKAKAATVAEEKTIDSIDTIVAILTSLIAIIISVIETL